MEIIFFALSLIQGGSSASWDAQHAFDDGGGSSSGIGFVGFLILLVMFIVGMYLWGKNMKN